MWNFLWITLAEIYQAHLSMPWSRPKQVERCGGVFHCCKGSERAISPAKGGPLAHLSSEGRLAGHCPCALTAHARAHCALLPGPCLLERALLQGPCSLVRARCCVAPSCSRALLRGTWSRARCVAPARPRPLREVSWRQPARYLPACSHALPGRRGCLSPPCALFSQKWS